MTTTEAQAIIISCLEDWANTMMADFVEESILNGGDAEALQALQLVGTDFNWSASIKTDDTN